MNKIKIVRFFSGILIVVFLGAVFATVKVVFFDCKYGQCIVSECVEVNQKCEDESYDPKTGQVLGNCCSDYETHNIPFRDYLMRQIKFYSLICGSGLGIALGAFLADRSKKVSPSQSSNAPRLIISDPMPITFWERLKDKLKRYLP